MTVPLPHTVTPLSAEALRTFAALVAVIGEPAAIVDVSGAVLASNDSWDVDGLGSLMHAEASAAFDAVGGRFRSALQRVGSGVAAPIQVDVTSASNVVRPVGGAPLTATLRPAADIVSGALPRHVLVTVSDVFRRVVDTDHPVVSGFIARQPQAGHEHLGVDADDGAGGIVDVRSVASPNEWIQLRDPISGLVGFGLFAEYVSHEQRVAQRRGSPVVLAAISARCQAPSVDGDDAVAAAVGARLRASLRPSDVASRDSDGRFWALIVDVGGADAAELVASRLLADLSRTMRVGTVHVSPLVSIGINVADASGDPEGLFGPARQGLDVAEASGGGRFCLAERSGVPTVGRHLIDLARLESPDQIVVHYQPIIDCAAGRIVGVEALMRWIHPHYGEVSPSEFIGPAKSSGIFAELADRALVTAVEEWASLVGELPDPVPRLFVNLSPEQIRAPQAIERLHHLLIATGLPPARLVVEVVEEAMLPSADEVVARLAQLRSMGVGVAIDDFGAGYSSLARLREISIDVLKVDRALVHGLCGDARARQILSSILALADNLGVECIVEGCETAAETESLASLGFRLMQGFHFGRPMNLQAIRALIEQGRVVGIT